MYFPPVMDWEVQYEGRENGLKCCGGFLKCCVTSDPAEEARGEGTQSYSETWTRLEQPSAKDAVICKAPTTFFQIFPVKTLVLLVGAERRLAARCVALHWLLLTSFVFLVGFDGGFNFIAATKDSLILVHADGSCGGQCKFLVSNRGRIGR